MSIQELPPELKEKARTQINEVEERIQEDLQHIKDWLKKQPHLRARTDDQWLLAFLRGCKYSLERTKEKLDFFYTVRSMLPEFFANRDPMNPDIQDVLKTGAILPLINKKSVTEPAVVFARGGCYDPTRISTLSLLKCNIMLMDISLLENHASLINGMHFVHDLKDMQFAHFASPTITKKAITVFQEAYPTRPQGMHAFNLPSIAEAIINMAKAFLSEKMKKSMNIYTNGYEEMFEKVPKHVFPKEYGGEGDSIEEMTEYWKKKVESYRDWFLEDAQYGCDEKLRPGKPKTSDELFGIEGSFRKLNVD